MIIACRLMSICLPCIVLCDLKYSKCYMLCSDLSVYGLFIIVSVHLSGSSSLQAWFPYEHVIVLSSKIDSY